MFDFDLTNTFSVLVGKEPNHQRFTVYHDILVRCSKFFRAAKSALWTTKPGQATVLDDHEPDVFSVYLHCFNFGEKALEEHIVAIPMAEGVDNAQIASYEQAEKAKESEQDYDENDFVEETQSGGLESDDCKDSDEIDHHVWKFGDNEFRDKSLVDLYFLADKLLGPITANMAINKLIPMTEERPQMDRRCRGITRKVEEASSVG